MVAIVLFIANVILYSQGTGATKSKIYRQAITTDLVNLINTEKFNIKYERNVGRENSFTLDLMYNYSYNSKEHTNIGIVLGGGYRWYFHKLIPELRTRGIEGLAVGPFAYLNYIRHTPNGKNYSNDFGIDFGGEAMYKFVLFEKLAIEPTLRLGWGASSAVYYTTGFLLWPGVSIGYAF